VTEEEVMPTTCYAREEGKTGRCDTTWAAKLMPADRTAPPVRHHRFKRGALGGTRTPNLLIRSQMLYPLSYERLS
jgi:hypothetical protein